MISALLGGKVVRIVIIIAIIVAGFGLARHAIGQWEDSIRASVVEECNSVQLEEELAFEKRKSQDLEARNAVLQGIVDNFEPEVIERVEFRDRILTETKIIQGEVSATEEGRLREELSPTSRNILDELVERTAEHVE